MPKRRRPYSNLETQKSLSSRELYAEISARTDVRIDIVEEIVNTLTDIAVEEIVNKESFKLRRLITFTAHDVEYTEAGMGIAPKTRRLVARVSSHVREIRRRFLKTSTDDLLSYDELTELPAPVATPKPPRKIAPSPRSSEPVTPVPSSDSEGDWNPILDDDDDEF